MKRLLRQIQKPLSASVDRQLHRERVMVESPERGYRLWVTSAALFVVALGCWWVARPDYTSGPQVVCGLFVGWSLGSGAFRSLTRARAYQSGWLAGRTALVESLREAQLRGMSMQEWLESELERDLHLLKYL